MLLTMPEACAGGDAFFTICLWRSGFALTDPGFSIFNPDAKLFDPFQYEVWLSHVQDASQCELGCLVSCIASGGSQRGALTPFVPTV